MNKNKNVIAIIVTYNRLEKLKISWAAIARQDIYGVVIVNNNSSDGTKEWIDSIKDQRLKPLHLNSNTGGAGGFRKGCEYGLAVFKNADWFLLFDDDAYAHPDLLEQFFNTPYNCDLVSAKVVTPSGCTPKMNLPLVKIPSSFRDILNYSLKNDNFTVNPDNDRAIKVAVSSFVGLFVSYNCLKHMVGAMKPDFFIYCDDAYFTFQTYISGYTNYYMPNLIFSHDISYGKTNSTKLYYLIRNDIAVKKAFSPNHYYCFILIRFFYYAATVFYNTKSLKHIPTMFRALIDGVKGNFTRPHAG